MTKVNMNKQYLGEDIFVEHDGYNFILTRETEVHTRETIILEPYMVNFLKDFVDKRHQEKDREDYKKQGVFK